jgi:hypothetical protein
LQKTLIRTIRKPTLIGVKKMPVPLSTSNDEQTPLSTKSGVGSAIERFHGGQAAHRPEVQKWTMMSPEAT